MEGCVKIRAELQSRIFIILIVAIIAMMAGSIASIFIQFDNPFEDKNYKSSYSNNNYNNSSHYDYSNYSNSKSNTSKYSYNKTNQSEYYTDDENLSFSDRIKNFINTLFGDK